MVGSGGPRAAQLGGARNAHRCRRRLACDLPMDYIEKHRIQILPITIHLDGQDLVDQRVEQTTLHFYREHLGVKGDAGSSPFSVELIRDVFLSKLVIDYDYVFCLTIASSRSRSEEHTSELQSLMRIP